MDDPATCNSGGVFHPLGFYRHAGLALVSGLPKWRTIERRFRPTRKARLPLDCSHLDGGRVSWARPRLLALRTQAPPHVGATGRSRELLAQCLQFAPAEILCRRGL